MSRYGRGVADERIGKLAMQGMDLVTFWRSCTEVLTPVMPHYMAPCWFTLDPASLLVTSHFQEGLEEIPPEWLAQEYYEDDFNKMADVAGSQRGVSTLHEATDGQPARSPRYQSTIVAHGGEQEMLAGLRTTSGEVWGVLGLYREPGQARFDDDDQAFVKALAPALAEEIRRALLLGEATDPEGTNAPGLLVLGADWSIESMTPGAEEWLADLPDGDWERGRLASAVHAVAGRALRTAAGGSPGEVAFARVLSRSGRWIVLHGAALVSQGAQRAAVIIEPAHPARIIPLLMAAYQLSEREQDVTRLVLQGRSTVEIAQTLHISAHTVQDHLKSVFEKTSVHSRRDLVGKIFFSHYEPRVRDNEDRARVDLPLRGGPIPWS